MTLLRWFGSFFNKKPLPLSESDAAAIAREACLQEEWEWKEPVRCKRRGNEYRFWTNASMRGGNVSIVVDGKTGEVMSRNLIGY